MVGDVGFEIAGLPVEYPVFIAQKREVGAVHPDRIALLEHRRLGDADEFGAAIVEVQKENVEFAQRQNGV